MESISFLLITLVVILCFKGWQRRNWYTPIIYATRKQRRALKHGKARIAIKKPAK